MITIVVAHYNENLEWIKGLNHPFIKNIIIYSKYNNNQNHNGLRIQNINSSFLDQDYFLSLHAKAIYYKLVNNGRESETYLRYCYDYYNNLSDATIFLQGEPHVGMDTINNWILYLSNNHDYTPNITIGSIFDSMNNGHLPLWYGKCDKSKYNCFTWMRTYVNQNIYPYKNKIYFGACFGVSKNRILSRTRDYYLDLIEKEFIDINPESAHFAERLWFYIFNCDKIL